MKWILIPVLLYVAVYRYFKWYPQYKLEQTYERWAEADGWSNK